jgi:hypothetical protein
MRVGAQDVPHAPSDGLVYSVRQIPFYFEENRGQASEATRFVASNGTIAALIRDDGAVFSVGSESVSMNIQGAAATGFRPENPVDGVSNYYLDSRTMTGLQHYAQVRGRNIKPGMDIIYHGTASELEYDLVLRPYADPAGLRLTFNGMNQLYVEGNGDLRLRTDTAELRLRKPEAWQEASGQRHRVSCSYQISGKGEVILILGPYDHSRELTIDPVISFSTFLSSGGEDSLLAVAVDNTGVYVTGTSYTSNFPVTFGTSQGKPALFVTKFNLSGTALIYSTIMTGGAGRAMVADGSGNVYIAGTGGTDFSNTTIENGEHIFVAKVNSSGGIIYATLLAGNEAEDGQAIAIDSTGAAYVAGTTYSTIFPTTPGALKSTLSGTSDAIVAKLTPSGGVAYATYLGGSSNDSATGITVDGAGNAYVAGWTQSSDFPTTAGAYSTTFKAIKEAFVTVLNPSGSAVVSSTLMGGTFDDYASGIVRDSNGDLYITGSKTSTNFPATFTVGSGVAAFVAKFNSSLSSLLYSVTVGGAIEDSPAMAVDQFGSAYIATTCGVGAPITAGGFDTGRLGNLCFFQVSPSGTAISYSGRIGAGMETATGIAIDGSGGVYVAGYTGNTIFPTTLGSFEPVPVSKTSSSYSSGVLTKIDLNSSTSCTTSLGATPGVIPGNGGAFAVDFAIPTGCPWGIASDTIGVSLAGPIVGISEGSPLGVNVSVPPNPSTNQRTVNLYVAEKTVPITQAAASCYLPAVSPLPLTLDAAGDSQNVAVTLPILCEWNASVNVPWLTLGNLSPGSQNGSRTLTLSALPFSYSQRTGTVTIANANFTATQTGSGVCTASASATLQNPPSSGGTGEIRVSVSNASCTWAGYSLAPWIQVAAASSGQGDGSLPYIVSANPGTIQRSGQVLVADQLVTITQAAGPSGTVIAHAVSLFVGGSGIYQDGVLAIEAAVGTPVSLFFDSPTGNFYFADDQYQRVRIVTPDGVINTVGQNLPINEPTAVTVDPSGNVYIGDLGRVWKLGQGAFAGTGTYGFSGDHGPASSAEITNVAGLAADSSHVYISDQLNGRIRVVSSGTITTLAGGGTNVQSDGEPATQAELTGPSGVTLDRNGDVVFADSNSIRTVSQGIIKTLPVSGGSLNVPQSLAYDLAGNLFIVDSGGASLVEVSPTGKLSAFVVPLGVQPSSVTTDQAANLYVGDSNNHAIWKFSPITFCNYSVTQPSPQPIGGGPSNLTVITEAECAWTAISDLSWVTVSSGSSGTGSGSVQLAIAPNAGISRVGTVAIAGQSVVISQLGIPPPSAVSASPSKGSGLSQTFTATFSDGAGAGDIVTARILINSSFLGTNACYLVYKAGTGVLNLLSDAGVPQSGIAISTPGTLSNSQCTVNVGASSVVSSGNTLTLNLAVTFTSAFAGAKDIYLEAQSTTVVGRWLQMGTWSVPESSSAPTSVSVSPSSGSGSSQMFTATFSDAAGASDIVTARILINNSFSGTNACYLVYKAGTNVLNLLSDAGALQSGIAIGSAGTLSNGQCTVNVGASSAVSSGNTLTLNLAVTFSSAFADAQDIYLEAQSSSVLGSWLQTGTWTVP